MLTAHTSHLIHHPDYMQPLQSAPVSIELDAKKSPLALLAQTCSQIGKPDLPTSKLGSISHSDKEHNGRSSSSSSSHKLGDNRIPQDDKSSFKPYNKIAGDGRRDGVSSSNNSCDKSGFRVPSNGNVGAPSNSASGSVPSFPPHAISPDSRVGSGTPPQHTQQPSHTPRPSQSPGHHVSHLKTLNEEHKQEVSSPHRNSSRTSGCHLKKESDVSKASLDGPQLANSSHTRASANSSTDSSEGSPSHEGAKADSHPPQLGLGSGHIAPISPYKTGHPVFPLSSSSMGYHGSVVGAYAGYPSHFVPGLDPTKSGLGGAGVGLPGKHPSSSPLTGASPPSFMQGLCRDPYCLSYPNAPHLGGSNPCVHDPSSALKSGYPGLVYPSHPLHSLHPSTMSSSMSPSLSHPLYTYGFMLANDPTPHACNWVSAAGPCDKRFSTSDELLSHLRTHTSLSGGMDGKLLSAYPSVSSASAASCHLHLPHSNQASLPNSFSLRSPHTMGLARYHPYGKVHLPSGPTSIPLHSLQSGSPYYPHYTLYSQRLGSASALGYQ
ncbi:hypothetical protein UPYG_G00279670 [Umbra pygmaea]|uniref:C2H2-type domain-containing protein n=1 Tax=Umbra pygmaea TaxID=75934 RepID=A0ABD0WKT4_UMBPY